MTSIARLMERQLILHNRCNNYYAIEPLFAITWQSKSVEPTFVFQPTIKTSTKPSFLRLHLSGTASVLQTASSARTVTAATVPTTWSTRKTGREPSSPAWRGIRTPSTPRSVRRFRAPFSAIPRSVPHSSREVLHFVSSVFIHFFFFFFANRQRRKQQAPQQGMQLQKVGLSQELLRMLRGEFLSFPVILSTWFD